MADTPLLAAMPTSLTWPQDDLHPDEVRRSWAVLALGALQVRLRDLGERDPDRAARLSSAMASLTPERRSAIVLAPTTTALTLPGRSQHPGSWVDDLESAVRRQRPGAGSGMSVPGLPSVDLDSDHARTIDVTGRDLTVGVPRPVMSGQHRRETLRRMGEASALLEQVDATIARFVRDFTLHLIVQVDEDDERFSSGSHGYFVGRTLLTNAHRPGLSPADIVDALVHEAIHSLLYMQEDQEPWLLDPELSRCQVAITSPWSGNPLPLRPYLQACFVWFGLTHLWARAAGIASDDDVRRLLVRASRGFLGPRLTDAVAPFRSGLQPALLQALDEMQQRVCHAVAEPA